MVYTRAKVRADVTRIIELYRRSGRFAATVEPKIIQREQNRVDVVFEIAEGPKSRVSRVNFLGNKRYSDGDLRDVMATKESRWWKLLTSNDTYDPDRLAYDRELIRQHYLQNGYADFRIISAVAELTPDQEDFFITFVIEEGEIYDFGKLEVESEIKDLKPEFMKFFLRMREGGTYNAKKIEDTIESMTNAAGLLGFAFLDIRPQINRERDQRILNITFRILETSRTYIERIDIRGNVRTLDRVIRREFRLAEGDAFNSALVNRSEVRLNALGFFREVSVDQVQGNQEDRVILDVTVEEQSTGEMSIGAGFSSLENFLIDFSISERNLLGKGQTLRLGATLSSRRKQIDLGFTEPYFMGRNLAAGIDIFRREFDSRNESSFDTTSTGGQARIGFPISEYIRATVRYTLRLDEVSVGGLVVSPFILAAAGTNTTSSIGYTVAYNTVNNYLRPSRGTRVVFGQDLAGLGGNIRYVRTNLQYDYYRPIFGNFIFHLGSEIGYIHGLGQDVRINDRFFLGGPTIRGFDTAGVGPRDISTGDFLGGNLMYVASAGFRLPLGAAAEEMGIQVVTFLDVGSLTKPDLSKIDIFGNPTDNSTVFDTGSPRVSAGVGIIWDSPFGPFRIDLAKAIMKEPFDRTEFLQFNIGTQF
jgi:outer membrane protein insertion porin family